MAYGVTINGFVKKRLDVIKLEIETSLKATFGDDIALIPQSVLGHIVGLLAERESNIWEQLEAVYNAFYPSTAQGAALSEQVILNGIERLPDETDAELRARRETSVGALGNNLLDALFGQLVNLDGVIKALVLDNKTDLTDADGIPPHQFLNVVQGGLEADIATTIWRNTPQGISSYGDITATVTDSQGNSQEVFYSRPTEVPIYFVVNVTTNGGYPLDGADQIKQNIKDYGDANFLISNDIILSRFYTPINQVDGVVDIEIFIGTAPAPTGTINIPIALVELGTFDIANITVNEV